MYKITFENEFEIMYDDIQIWHGFDST